jgi:hypothetical protein
MKIKILSLVLIALLAVSVVGTTCAVDDNNDGNKNTHIYTQVIGLEFAGLDAAANWGRQYTLEVYDNNHNLIGTLQDKFTNWNPDIVIFPANTYTVHVKVETWEVEGLGWNQHWDVAYDRTFGKDELLGKIRAVNKSDIGWYDKYISQSVVQLRKIVTTGTAWSGNAEERIPGNNYEVVVDSNIHYI